MACFIRSSVNSKTFQWGYLFSNYAGQTCIFFSSWNMNIFWGVRSSEHPLPPMPSPSYPPLTTKCVASFSLHYCWSDAAFDAKNPHVSDWSCKTNEKEIPKAIPEINLNVSWTIALIPVDSIKEYKGKISLSYWASFGRYLSCVMAFISQET